MGPIMTSVGKPEMVKCRVLFPGVDSTQQRLVTFNRKGRSTCRIKLHFEHASVVLPRLPVLHSVGDLEGLLHGLPGLDALHQLYGGPRTDVGCLEDAATPIDSQVESLQREVKLIHEEVRNMAVSCFDRLAALSEVPNTLDERRRDDPVSCLPTSSSPCSKCLYRLLLSGPWRRATRTVEPTVKCVADGEFHNEEGAATHVVSRRSQIHDVGTKYTTFSRG